MTGSSRQFKRLFLEGSTIVAGATVISVLVGFLKTQAYFQRLGVLIPADASMVHEYMGQSFDILLFPVVIFLAYPGIEATTLWVERRATPQDTKNSTQKGEPDGLFRTFSGPAVAAIISLGAAAHAFASIGGGNANIQGIELPARQILTWALYASAVVFILRVQRAGEASIYHGMFGKSLSGHLFLSVLAIIGLSSAAVYAGVDQGSDAAWGCVSLPVISFDPHPHQLNASHEYWLITHSEGTYLVRDLALKGNETGHAIISDHAVESATVSWQDAVRPC